MFRKISLLVLCCIASLTIVAQNTRLVKGVVFSDQEIPLKGATITLIGMPGSTQTDENGLFEFSVSPYAKQVEATCEGYLSQKAEIDGTYLIFKLKVDKKYAKQKAKEEEEARKAAQKEAEAKAKAEEEARIAAQKAEEQARIATQREAEAKVKAEEEARIAAQREAEAKAKAEEEARIAAQKAEEQARIAAQREAEAKAQAEEQARLAAEKAERDSIAKIAAEKRHTEYAQQRPGFASMIDLSYRLSLTTGYSNNMGLNYIAGYRINNTLLVGAGVGVNLYTDATPSSLTIENIQGTPLKPSSISVPVFAYFRYNFINTQCSPFFALAAGYEISDQQELELELLKIKYNTGGLFVNPQVGVNFRTTLNTSLYLAVGFQGYTMPYCIEHTGYNATLKPSMAYGVDVHLGFAF